MKTRIVIGLGLIGLLYGLYLLDTQVLARPILARIVVWLFALGALREVLTLGSVKVDCAPGLFLYGGIAVVAIVVPSLVTGTPVPGSLIALAAVAGAGIRLIGMAPLRSAAVAFPEALLLAGGVLYTAGLLSFLDRIAIVSVPMAFAVVAVSKSGDICAYFVGTLFGRKKIAPAISPKKTWEGTIAGVLGAAGVAALLSAELQGPPEFSALIGALIGAATFLGDLLGSGLKRWASAKDSANLLPEFGGVIDLVDGILLAAPVAIVCLLGT